MTKQEAVDFYLRKTPKAVEAIRRIQKWNEQLTVAENAKNIGIKRPTLGMFAKKYGLTFRKELTKKELLTEVKRLEEENKSLKRGYNAN